MRSRLDTRLRRLEAQAYEGPHRQGLAALLEWGRRNGVDEERVPLKALSDAELDTKITALTGTRGLSLLLKEALEEERTRRQGAQGRSPQPEPSTRPPVDPVRTASPSPGDVLHSPFRPVVTKGR